MRRFCSVCGKSTDVLHEGLCTQCFLKEHEFTSLPEVLDTILCNRCLRQYTKGGWQKNGQQLEQVLNNVAKKEVQHSLKSRLENAKFDILVEEIKKLSKGRFDVICKVVVEGIMEASSLREEKWCTVRINLQLCPDCSRISGGYYEAILQIRGAGLLAEDDIGRISDDVASLMEDYSGEAQAFISKFKRLKEGADFYFGSAKIARKVSHVLRRNYGGELLESAKLVGKSRSGKNKYRITIVLRLPKFKVNDVIEVGKRIIQVENLGRSKLKGFDLNSRSKTSFPLAKIKDARIIAGKDDIKWGVVSEVTPDRVQIIDMETYKTFYISWAKKGLNTGVEVEFIRNNNVYMLRLKNEA